MMIKCVKCGHENQLGSIFCHGCGEKIDMNQLSPDVMAQKSKQNRQSKAKKQMINNIIALVIFTICAAIVCAVLIPNGQKKRPSIPDAVKVSAAEKYKVVTKAIPGSIVSFTPEELTGLWSGVFSVTPVEGAIFEANSLFFEQNENDDTLSAYLTTRLQQNFDVTLRADISPEKSDGELPYEFNVSYAQMGHLPFFFLFDVVTQQYASVLESQPIKNAFSKAKEVSFENGLLTFKF